MTDLNLVQLAQIHGLQDETIMLEKIQVIKQHSGTVCVIYEKYMYYE